MAKQTFTTGQVLTAAQMTSLQETAMGGGPATAKVASYVLVAADAGTTVAMNAAGATTITVNTGLFAAGDTVFIQNLGAGACTVTAGTATVATAGSLILPQNDAGILYFTSASAAIFYDYIQAGAVSPLTTKGDLYTFSTSDARLGVGANGTTIVADSSQATGLKWAAPGGMTLLASGTLSGATTSISVTGTGSYNSLLVIVRGIDLSTAANVKFGFNAIGSHPNFGTNATTSVSTSTSDLFLTAGTTMTDNAFLNNVFAIQLFNVQTESPNDQYKPFILTGYYQNSSSVDTPVLKGGAAQIGAVSSVEFATSTGTFSAGSVKVYGVK